jgi:sulfur carrier protein
MPISAIFLNGEAHQCRLPDPTVADLVRELALQGKRIAVERNGEIVPRSEHATTRLFGGDKIEVVVAVGGG